MHERKPPCVISFLAISGDFSLGGGIASFSDPAPVQEEVAAVCNVTSCAESYELSCAKTVISITSNSHGLRWPKHVDSQRLCVPLFAIARECAIPPSGEEQTLFLECKTGSQMCDLWAGKGRLDEAYFCNQAARCRHSFFIPFCVTHHTRKRCASDRIVDFRRLGRTAKRPRFGLNLILIGVSPVTSLRQPAPSH